MQIHNAKLTNYRSHKKREFQFDPKITLIFGPNGSGKTNILEAIHLLSTTKSFRSEYEKEVISHLQEFARIDAQMSTVDDEKKLEMVITKSQIYENASSKKVKVNGVAKALSDFAGTLNSVLFSPEDIGIITGSPAQRRKYLDLILFQIDHKYKNATSIYIKALRQRNKILELIAETSKGQDQIDFWTQKILENGIIIQEKRAEMFLSLKHKVESYGKALNTPNFYLQINYKKNEMSQERLNQYKEREIAAKNTLVGPHKDDFQVLMNEFDLANFGSRGQQRSAVLALKLAETDFLCEKTNEHPVLLLDDIFSELDDKHRDAINNVIDKQQTIITSAEISDFENAKIILL